MSIADILGSSKDNLEVQITALMEQENALLKDLTEHQRNNKLMYFNTPTIPANPPQADLLTAWDDSFYKTFTFTGGNRIGKTVIGATIGESTLFGKWLWNNKRMYFNHRYPRKVRYVGQDWEGHIKAVLIPALKEWWPKDRQLLTKKNNIGVECTWIDVETGSQLQIVSNKQELDSLEGWYGDLVIYDEPPKRDVRIACARGLVDRQGRELLCATLIKEAWVDQEIIKAKDKLGNADFRIYNVHGEIYDNIGFGITQEGVDDFASKLNPAEKNARLKGVPSYISGLIYPMFRRAIHLKKPIKDIPLDWILDIAIDFHPSKEWAVLFVATDRMGFKYIISEIWEHGSWQAIGDKIVRYIKGWELRIANIIIDPLAKGNSNTDLMEETVYSKMDQLFAGHGYYLNVASKNKETGIEIVKNLLWTDNEMAALFIFNPGLPRTLMEIEGWGYDEKTLKPMKKNDDMMENLYRIALLDTIWEPLRWEEEDKEERRSNSSTGY